MNQSAPVSKLTQVLSWLSALIIVLIPFHAFLTVWLSSLTGHYTAWRLWKEFLILPIVIGCLYLLAHDRSLAKRFLSLKLVWLIAAYFAVLLICGISAVATHNVTQKAMWYGLLVDSRFLVFFLAVLVLATKSSFLSRNRLKLLLGPPILVAAFAILQYLVLPYDFLKHFGYSQSTIFPYETINHNINRIRVASTLRGANPLGAYLIIPISFLAVMLFKEKSWRRDKLLFGFGLLLALAFSFSRSAWLGAGLSLLLIAGLALKSVRSRMVFARIATVSVILIVAAALFLRNNTAFQDTIFHTDNKSTIKISSNEGHSSAFKAAAKDIYHHPLGSGVGTAGPQSYYNHQKQKLAENYFLQIGQEAGLIGLILFIGICGLVGLKLYERRNDPLALALLASLIGLSLVNLLSHAWSDDSLAYVWWGLAGIALAPILTDKLKRNNAKKIKKPA